MKLFNYSIYDSVSKEYGPFFPAKNDDVAIRAFKNTLKGVPDIGEYKLFCMHSYDSESGQIDLYFNKYEVQVFEPEVKE